MAPMGVVSVSPVARQQTRATTKDMATATRPSQGWMEKARYWRITMPMVMGIRPPTSQETGTSTSATGSAPPVCPRGPLNEAKARPRVRHWSATEVRLEKTMMAVPPQRAQRVGTTRPFLMTSEGT